MLFLVKSVIPEGLLLSLMGSALASCGSILEPSGVGSLGHGEASGSFNRSQPVAPLATKTLPHKPRARIYGSNITLEIAIQMSYFGCRRNQNSLIFTGVLLKLNKKGTVT